MRRKDARVHAPKLYMISDIHGTYEALIQFLLQTDLVKIERRSKRAHVVWNDRRCRHSAIVILGDLTDRVRGDRGHDDEMTLEEMRIIITIYHLNATHKIFHNAIMCVLGNHDINNMIGSPLSSKFSSAKCHRYLDDKYRDPLSEFPFDLSGRRKMFLGRKYTSTACKRTIARNLVTRGEWPKENMYYRDFSKFDISLFFPRHGLLAVHGGVSEFLSDHTLFRKPVHERNPTLADYIRRFNLQIGPDTNPQKWCSCVNGMAKHSIYTGELNPVVNSIMNDRGMSQNITCTPSMYNLNYIAVGHSQQKNPSIACNILRVDLGNNAQTSCTPGMPCRYKTRCIVLHNGKVTALASQDFGSTVICEHELYAHHCPHCSDGSLWTEADFL